LACVACKNREQVIQALLAWRLWKCGEACPLRCDESLSEYYYVFMLMVNE
jgi:hypothetical protein